MPKSESESEFEESIAEINKLRTQRFDEIAKTEKEISVTLFEKYFGYLISSNMYKALKETESLEKNKTKVNIIENSLANLIGVLKDTPKSDPNKIAENNKIVVIIERILYFNNKNKKEQGIKILTPNQMLNRLPISLAQLKARNNSEKLKNEIRQLLHSLHRSKKLTKQIYKSLMDII